MIKFIQFTLKIRYLTITKNMCDVCIKVQSEILTLKVLELTSHQQHVLLLGSFITHSVNLTVKHTVLTYKPCCTGLLLKINVETTKVEKISYLNSNHNEFQ